MPLGPAVCTRLMTWPVFETFGERPPASASPGAATEQ
jgi:hypothetical protein